LRLAQLAAHPLCCLCAKLGIVRAATVVDHIEPHKGNEELFFAAANLQSMCKPCHDGAKQELERTGRLRGSGLDGVPLDPLHPWNRAG
jgi:5-methylcytosine-specific restriction endonuclease McrA